MGGAAQLQRDLVSPLDHLEIRCGVRRGMSHIVRFMPCRTLLYRISRLYHQHSLFLPREESVHIRFCAGCVIPVNWLLFQQALIGVPVLDRGFHEDARALLLEKAEAEHILLTVQQLLATQEMRRRYCTIVEAGAEIAIHNFMALLSMVTVVAGAHKVQAAFNPLKRTYNEIYGAPRSKHNY